MQKGWKYYACVLGSQLMWPFLAIRHETGLLSFNNADAESPVLVTTNYYLTASRVMESIERQHLKCHLLIVDSHGINVWCGSRGGHVDTDSVLKGINETNLASQLTHRNLILPQLAASSVSKGVLRDNGWSAEFGPVEINDVGKFIDRGSEKSSEESIATFNLDRRLEYNLGHMVLETVMFLVLTAVFWLLGLMGGLFLDWTNFWIANLFLIILGAWLLGTFMAIMDPAMPTSSGYVRGLVTGIIALIIWKVALLAYSWISPEEILYILRWLDVTGLTILGLSLFVGFNWGGCTPQLGEDQMLRDIIAGLASLVVLFTLGFYFPMGIF
ncbi:MAG: hypothetical protein ACFFAY_14935 [Promethearchaeota archaeon]